MSYVVLNTKTMGRLFVIPVKVTKYNISIYTRLYRGACVYGSQRNVISGSLNDITSCMYTRLNRLITDEQRVSSLCGDGGSSRIPGLMWYRSGCQP